VLSLPQKFDDFADGQPLLVLVPGDNGEDFLVEFHQFVAAMAAGDCHQQSVLYEFFLFPLEHLAFGEPAHLDGVLELDEAGLFDFHWELGVVDDFHHRHAET
jgi:hypothetical protein